MAKGIHRQGDVTEGHGCWPPTSPAAYSGNVFANGLPVVRQGDGIVPHTCPSIPETHGGVYTGGGSVYANGKPVQRVGSAVSCGDAARTGSGDVLVGD